MLPHPVTDKPAGANRQSSIGKEFFRSFARFFEKKKIFLVLVFLMLYWFGEAQIAKMATPFMLDGRDAGGLGLSTSEVGFIYGTVGIVAFIFGGILGGYMISKKGLRYWMWPMLLALNLPALLFIYMSHMQPASIWIIYGCIAVEQFGYGFSFSAYVMYMIHISEGEYKTSHYALATGFMALGIMLSGMFSGFIQEAVGYKLFFIWALIAAIPSFILVKFIPLDYHFGKKKLIES